MNEKQEIIVVGGDGFCGWPTALYLSAQGHNPWNCMHLSIKVGPLKQGQRRTINGKIYLFEGSREDCLQAFRRDFADRE